MKLVFAFYEHTRLGFPHVKLKWASEDGRWSPPYVVIKGIIQKDTWHWHERHPESWAAEEMKRFDAWVGERFSEDVSVQG
jgi:hypothetical protein